MEQSRFSQFISKRCLNAMNTVYVLVSRIEWIKVTSVSVG